MLGAGKTPVRVDAHHHRWDREHRPCWVDDAGWWDLPCDCGSAAFIDESKAFGVGCSVVVQASNTVEETRWLLDLASRETSILGVVGWEDLSNPRDVERRIWGEFRNTKLVGVRHALGEPYEDWLLSANVRKSVNVLASAGLSLEVFPHSPESYRHLEEALVLSRSMDDLTLVIGGLGGPDWKRGPQNAWKNLMKTLAREGNVYVKYVGLAERKARDLSVSDLVPFIEYVIEHFGAGRVIWGSNWPMCYCVGNYKSSSEMMVESLSGLSTQCQELVMGGSASVLYGGGRSHTMG